MIERIFGWASRPRAAAHSRNEPPRPTKRSASAEPEEDAKRSRIEALPPKNVVQEMPAPNISAEPLSDHNFLALPDDIILRIGLQTAQERPEQMLLLGAANSALLQLLRFSPDSERVTRPARVLYGYASAARTSSDVLHRTVAVRHSISGAALGRIVEQAVKETGHGTKRMRNFTDIAKVYAQLAPDVRQVAAVAAAAERGATRLIAFSKLLAYAPAGDEVLQNTIHAAISDSRSRKEGDSLRGVLAGETPAVASRSTVYPIARPKNDRISAAITAGGHDLPEIIAPLFSPKHCRTVPAYGECCEAVARNIARFSPPRRSEFVQHLRTSGEALGRALPALCANLPHLSHWDANFVLQCMTLYGNSEAPEDHSVFLRGIEDAVRACAQAPTATAPLHAEVVTAALDAESDEARVRALTALAPHLGTLNETARATLLQRLRNEDAPDVRANLLRQLVVEPAVGRTTLPDELMALTADLTDPLQRLFVYNNIHAEFPLHEPHLAAILHDLETSADVGADVDPSHLAAVAPHMGYRNAGLYNAFVKQLTALTQRQAAAVRRHAQALALEYQRRTALKAARQHFTDAAAKAPQWREAPLNSPAHLPVRIAHMQYQELRNQQPAAVTACNDITRRRDELHTGLQRVLSALQPALAGLAPQERQRVYRLGRELPAPWNQQFLLSWVTERQLLQPADYAAVTRFLMSPVTEIPTLAVQTFARTVPHLSDAQWAAVAAELKFAGRSRASAEAT